jgi:YVTN family beta-propeller protein
MKRRLPGFALTAIAACFAAQVALAAPFLYVCNHKGNSVSVIDTATDTLVDTIVIPGEPHDIGFTPDGLRGYVSQYSLGTVTEFDTATKEVGATVYIGPKPQGVATKNDGTTVYVTSSFDHTVTAVSTTTHEVVAVIQVGTDPDGLTNRPNTNEIWVANASNGPPAPPPNARNSVSVIDTNTNREIARFGVGLTPRRVAFSPDGGKGYTANGMSNNVSVVNATAKKTTGWLPSGGQTPRGLATTPNGLYVYVANNDSASIVKIDLRTSQVVKTIAVTRKPHRVTMLKDGSKIYVSHPLDDKVTVIETATDRVLYTIPVGKQPGGMGVAPTPIP